MMTGKEKTSQTQKAGEEEPDRQERKAKMFVNTESNLLLFSAGTMLRLSPPSSCGFRNSPTPQRSLRSGCQFKTSGSTSKLCLWVETLPSSCLRWEQTETAFVFLSHHRLTSAFNSHRRPNASRTSISRGRGSCSEPTRFPMWCSAAWETRHSARCSPRATKD